MIKMRRILRSVAKIKVETSAYSQEVIHNIRDKKKNSQIGRFCGQKWVSHYAGVYIIPAGPINPDSRILVSWYPRYRDF